MKSFSSEIFNQSTLSICTGETLFGIEDFLKKCSVQYDTKEAHLYDVSALTDIMNFLQERIHTLFGVDLFFNQPFAGSHLSNPDKDIFLMRHLRYLPAFPHVHDFFEIMCVIEGSCTNSIGDQIHHLKAGDVLIVAPGTMHAISDTDENSLIINLLITTDTFDSNFFYLLKDQTILSDFLKDTLYRNKKSSYLLFHASADSEIFTILTALYTEECSNKRYKSVIKKQLVELFFSLLLRNHEKDLVFPDPEGDSEDNNFIFILKYMEKRYQNITLQETARFFHYSERHMIRLLKKYTGLSFSQNIKKIRLNHAAELLVNTNLSQKEIASRVGYSNPSHLKELFIQEYQMSPVEYRKAKKQKK